MKCCYLGNTGTYYSTSYRQKVSYISSPRNCISCQLWAHWQTWTQEKKKSYVK